MYFFHVVNFDKTNEFWRIFTFAVNLSLLKISFNNNETNLKVNKHGNNNNNNNNSNSNNSS